MIVDLRSGMPPAKDMHGNMVNKIVDNPPAYSDENPSVVLPHPMLTSNLGPGNVALNPNPPPSVDQVHISERKQNIQGTFYIDPRVPALDRRKMKHKSKQPVPHASFRSRKGEVDLELATTGHIQDAPKANVAVSTRSGDIKITLLPMPPSRPRMGLDVQSRDGNIALFLPEGFSGVVHLTTRKGDMEILPALLACVKVVKSSDREVIFMIGTQNNVYELDASREASFCGVSSRKGSIIVGLSGRDHYSTQVGFWKRLGVYLRGDSGTLKEKSEH